MAPNEERLRPRDWVVAILLGLVLIAVILSIFRLGLAYLYG